MVSFPVQHVDAPGLDLDDPEVWRTARRLYWRSFSRRVLRVGLDPEDVWQDVAVGIIRRQKGASKWDPSRSGMVHYLWIVIGSLVSHCIESHLARQKHVRPWIPSLEDDDMVEDPALARAEAPEDFGLRDLEELAEGAGVPVDVLVAVAEGMTAREAVQATGLRGIEAEAVAQRVTALGRRGRGTKAESGSVLDLFG